MNKNEICYTGVGSVKTGNHTKKQYLEVMNKNNKTKKCNLKKNILFSGAEFGKCDPH